MDGAVCQKGERHSESLTPYSTSLVSPGRFSENLELMGKQQAGRRRQEPGASAPSREVGRCARDGPQRDGHARAGNWDIDADRLRVFVARGR